MTPKQLPFAWAQKQKWAHKLTAIGPPKTLFVLSHFAFSCYVQSSTRAQWAQRVENKIPPNPNASNLLPEEQRSTVL